MILLNFYQRTSRGSSRVKLLFSGPQFLYSSIKPISAQRLWTFSLPENWKNLEPSAKDFYPVQLSENPGVLEF